METISINRLRTSLKEVLQRVAEDDQPVLVTFRGEPLAEITPPSAAHRADAARQVQKDDAPAPRAEVQPEMAQEISEATAGSRSNGRAEATNDDEEPTERPRRRRRRRRRGGEDEATDAPPVSAQRSSSGDLTPETAQPVPALVAQQADNDEDDDYDADDDFSDAFESSIRAERDDDSYRAIPQHPVETIEGSFASFGLSEPILRCIREIGFENPTPIQAAVIPPALEGHDIIGLAQTGSGKTAAFCLPMAERFSHGRGVRGLILSPTREIAMQTKAFLDLFGKDRQLDTVCLIGGVPMGPQITGLKRNPDILVATPGRLLDHVRRRNVSLDNIEELVLDEADHMLDLGFLPQIANILDHVPDERRTMMFSATMPQDIERLAQRLMDDPVRIDILPEGAAEGISHRLYLVTEDDEKKKCAIALLNQELGSTLVFIRRKVDAEWLTKVLMKEGHPVARIHSDLSQKQRVRALSSFREGQHRILVATDIAARGLDVPRIQHVINFDLPDQVEDYIHRAGRTARGKLRGTVSSIGTWKDKLMVREIESGLGEEIPRCTVPGVEPYVERNAGPSGRGRHRLPTRRRL